MNYAEATKYLFSLGHETLTMKLGLRNTELLLAKLGNPHADYEAVQIAGTNGKGSTATMLDAICRSADIATGLYTSPHLVSITERVKIDGRDISQEAFASCATKVRVAAENLVAAQQLEVLPTFFEHVTAIALLAFKKANVKVAILETGLGGRLDSTTAVRANIVGITPISMDHQEYLGNTLAEIAAEKAAVIRAGSKVILAPQPDEACRVILERCRETAVTPVWTDKEIRGSSNGSGYTFKTARETFASVQVALRGAHQLTNAATAIALAQSLAERGFPITPAAIINGLATAKHPGRLEMFGDRVLLDGAHNPAGAMALRVYLDELARHDNISITLVFGAMIDKQLDQMTATLFPVASHLILTEPRNPRAAKGVDLSNFARTYAPLAKVEITETSEAAMARAMASESKLIVVAGSLYLVGEARAWLIQQASEVSN